MAITKIIKSFSSKIIKFGWRVIFFLILTSALISLLNLTLVKTVSAQDTGWWNTVSNGGLNEVGNAYTTGEPRDPRIIVADIIKIVLGFLGVLAVVLILYAGFKWMTSGGNEEKVGGAKKILVAGVIGLALILSAYLIANFVINRIYGAVNGQPVLFN